MPKIKPTDTELKNRQARGALDDYFASRGMDHMNGLASLCGFTTRTASDRYKDPGCLTVSELRRLKGITDEQIIKIVRGKMPEKQPITIYLNGTKMY